MDAKALTRLAKATAAARNILKQDSPRAAQDAATLVELWLGALPKFVENAETFAELSDGVVKLLAELPKTGGRFLSALKEGMDVAPGSPPDDAPSGAVLIGEVLAKALIRLRSSTDGDLRDALDDLSAGLEDLGELADVLAVAEDDDVVSLSKSFPNGMAEGGVHVHNLLREEARTKLDGRHAHSFYLPYGISISNNDYEEGISVDKGSVFETNEDGPHEHPLIMDAGGVESASSNGSRHRHVVTLANGYELITETDGSHGHETQAVSTGFDGSHTHILSLANEYQLVSLTGEELWHLSGSPDQSGDPPAPAASQLAQSVEVRMVSKADGKFPTLRVPDPQFLVSRRRRGLPVGLLSRVAMGGRSGVEQALVNEIAPMKIEGSHVWAIVVLGEAQRFDSVADVGDARLAQVAPQTRAHFDGASPVFFVPMDVVQVFAPPLRLTNAPTGRVQGSVVDLSVDVEEREDDVSALAPRAQEIQVLASEMLADDQAQALVYWGAEPPSGTLPALKVPDPQFLIERLRSGKTAGLLSRVRRQGRIGRPQALVNELRPMGFTDSFVWAVVAQGNPVQFDDIAAVGVDLLDGVDQPTREEFAAEEDVWYAPLQLLVIFDPPLQLKKPPPGRRFGSEIDFDRDVVKERQISIDDILREDARKQVHGFVTDPDVELLARSPGGFVVDLDRQMHELFERAFSGESVTQAEGVTREDVVNAHMFVLQELARRGIETAEDDVLAQETRALEAAGTEKSIPGGGGVFARILPGSSGKHADDPVELDEVVDALADPMALRMPCVFLVGSLCNQGRSANDVDVLIRGPLDPDTLDVIKFRIGRALPQRVSERVEFHFDGSAEGLGGGPFTNHVALYDLALVPHMDRELKEMSIVEAPHRPITESELRAFGKQDDPLLDWPDGLGKRAAVLQAHFRGASLHFDVRMQVNDHLVGWTLAAQKRGLPQVTTLTEGRELARQFDVAGSDVNKPMVLPSRVFAAPKARQPVVWLDLGDAVFEPGEVGATRNEPGVVIEVAAPKVEWGLQKPFSHEYFFTGADKFSGTLALRQLEGGQGGELFWTAGFTKSLLPSVLKRRAVETESMPPLGHSAMPETLMREVPRALRYWLADSELEAREVRDALVEEKIFTEHNIVLDGDGQYRRVEEKVVNAPSDPDDGERDSPSGSGEEKQQMAKFSLSWQWWKGQTVVRATPSRQVWHLMISEAESDDVDDYVLQRDPLSGEEAITTTLVRGSSEAMEFEGPVEPGEEIGGVISNRTKATPSEVVLQDSGRVELLDDQESFKKLRFHGEDIKGIYTLVAEEAGGDIWQFSPGTDPGRAIPGEEEAADAEKAHRLREDGTQVWDPDDVGDDDDRAGGREDLRPPALFQPPKPSARQNLSFSDPDEAAREVFTDELVAQGVQVEPKLNGFRAVAESWDAGVSDEVSDGGVLIFTEDAQRDIATNLPGLAAELEAIGGNFVVDGEIMAVDEDGEFLPRRELARFRGDEPVDDGMLRFVVFDALYLPDEGNITVRMLAERRKLLEAWWRAKGVARNAPRLLLADRKLSTTRDQLRKSIAWAGELGGSEGAMLKQIGSTYSLGGEHGLWAKVKSVREVRAVVLDRHEVEGSPGVFNFVGGIGPVSASDAVEWEETAEHGGETWVVIGRTGNRKLDAVVGDVISVDVMELLLKEGPPKHVRWFGPAQATGVVDDAPTTIAQIEALLRPDEVEKRGGSSDKAQGAVSVKIVKNSEIGEKRYVFGVMLVPNEPDSQGDIYDEETVEAAAHSFMEGLSAGKVFKIMHSGRAVSGVKLLETWVTKVEEIYGDEAYPIGTWLIVVRVINDDIWTAIKEGAFTGFSMGGSAIRELLKMARS